MTAERSSKDNDRHQVRATIGLAGGCPQQLRSVRHHEPVSRGSEDVLAIAAGSPSSARALSDISAAATRPER